MAILTTIFSVFPAVLTVISFAFTTLTTVNRDWAHQSHYTTTDASVWNKSNIAYTVYRSPFYACSPAAHYTNNTPVPADFIGQFNRGIGDALDLVTAGEVVVTITCARFRPYGFNKTSCETLVNVDVTDARYGDDRMCQQVHMAGGLAIASSVFIGLALLTTLGLAVLGILSSTASIAKVGLSMASFGCLFLGAALMFIAQFYGVLGLIQSQIPNGRFAEQADNPTATAMTAGPWIQGKASVIYGSVGWFGALCAAATLLAARTLTNLSSTANSAQAGVAGEPGLWVGKPSSGRDKTV
jgi:hypothetical protein